MGWTTERLHTGGKGKRIHEGHEVKPEVHEGFNKKLLVLPVFLRALRGRLKRN
jgi:hypothetical protein